MESEFVRGFLIAVAVCSLVGLVIGSKLGRPFAGLLWAFFLGPIGWIVFLLLPRGPAAGRAKPCPHCGGVLPLNQAKCNHCGNAVSWIQGRAFKPSRPL